MPLLPRSRFVAFAAWLLLAGLSSGCARLSSSMSDGITSVITPYKVEIVQGNVVTREQAALIKPGQTRAQVREVLGSPLLADPFHAQRWDYVFMLRRPGVEAQQRAVVVFFEGDVVKRMEAPELPSELEFVASITRPRSDAKDPKLALTDEERAALPAPVRSDAAAAAQPQGAVRSYPPLEARWAPGPCASPWPAPAGAWATC